MNWKFWKKIKHVAEKVIGRGYVFPCSSDECLVRMTCTKPCEKIVVDEDKLRDLFYKLKICPDCGSEKFMEGPHGGAAVNIKCRGCGHWFNLGLPLFVQRIHMDENHFYDKF